MKILSILAFLLFAVSADALSLRWTLNDPADNVTSYNVYTVKNTLTLRVSVAGDVNQVTIDSYLQGNRTIFLVKAVNVFGESPESARITVQRH